MMSVFGQSKPAYLKTYGKQKRRVEQWFSPDLRKKAFSFSSTPSSDQSIPELIPKKRKNNKKSSASTSSRTLRKAKQKAMEALKELESDEECMFVPVTAPRRKPSTKLIKKTAVTGMSPDIHGFASSREEHVSQYTTKRRNKQPAVSNRENESCIRQGESVDVGHVDRFVTRRKRAHRMQSKKHSVGQTLGISSHTLNTSKEIICSVPSFSHFVTKRKQATTQQESDVFHVAAHAHSGKVLREVSFNEVGEQMISRKHPLLCSTPCLATKRNVRCLEPSTIEISSFSCDELDKPSPVNESTTSDLMSKPQNDGTLQKNKLAKHTHQMCSSIDFGSSWPHLKQSNERAVMVEELDVMEPFSKQSDDVKQEVEKTYSPRLGTDPATSVATTPSFHGKRTCHMSSDYAISDTSNQGLHLTTSLSPSSLSSVSSPTYKLRSSLQTQIDRLKAECLSSCLTVCLQRLDLSTIRLPHQGIIETPKVQDASPLYLETTRSQNASLPCLVDTESAEQFTSVSELQTEGQVRRLSTSFMLSAMTPTPISASSKMPVSNEQTSVCTSRKVCVSGLNTSRWSKNGMGAQNRKQRKNEIQSNPGDCSSRDLLPTRADSWMGESACGWLQSSRMIGLPKTPLRAELLNLSSFLNTFTPDSLTTHSWGRLKAALSIHKRKTAFPTPRRLALSSLKHPELMDTSLELFGTPSHHQASSHLLRSSITNTSMISSNEDISDAEKVYQECQQEVPILFDDCIPPECMKTCMKIGEGTFGEVFSMVNKDSQTVALKIIPIEGHQKVNGELQKTFSEVLHEIIISKELSALNTQEHNKTDGFIGLINLHCVRGCYPTSLLQAWDKFDQEKGSENDRPDFFSKEQLFLILEFEFGGTDLENMNGKLTSLAQAKSVLHQVTAALAVAEEALCFEHRDLHWGNILVKNTKKKHNQFTLNGSVHSVETRGVHVNIIDYSLSRLEIDGLTVFCDIANEEELFMGQGDYQFEIYRLMKKENNNCWAEYKPHSNVLWLHYLAEKLLTGRYRNKAQSSQQKSLKNMIKSFHTELLNYHSAKDVLLHATLFQ